MRVVTTPAFLPLNGGSSPVEKFLSSLRKKRPDLWSLVDQQMRSIRHLATLEPLVKTEVVGNLKGRKAPLWEFRIPKRRPGGVVRIYFCYRTEEPGCIILLDAELKKGTVANTFLAEKRYWEIYG
jgi:hypothetical protein